MDAKKVIALGAEAELIEGEYLGRKALLKKRSKKIYRVNELDERIRHERTKKECLLLHKAKSFGVRSPLIYKVDRKNALIWMEFIEGKRLKNALNKENLFYCEELGKNIARMHEHNLIHGDLTTSNVLVHEKELVFIDFGLGFMSSKAEDKAVDLLNFKRTFLATHTGLEEGWEKLLKAYQQEFSDGKEVAQTISQIEKRVRYASGQ